MGRRRRQWLGLVAFGVGSAIDSIPDTAAAQPACTTPKTTCSAADGYYASSEDRSRVTAYVDPLLTELKACIDAAGGKHVSPAVQVRWDADGNPVVTKVEAPGYENLSCAAKVAGKLAQLRNPHETSIRCDYGCGGPPSPPPPPVVPPPTTSTPPPPPPEQPAAQAQETKPRVVRKTVKTWYGYQTLIVDAVTGTVLSAGVIAKVPGLTTPGVIGFGLGTPVVHWVHGNIGQGFGSLGIRLLLPLLAAGIGAIAGAMEDVNNKDPNLHPITTGAEIGMVLGLIGCAAIDAAGLAYTKEDVDVPADAGPGKTGGLTLHPGLAVAPGRASVGLNGSF